ncbi:MAG: hypothetical protein AAFP92_21185 [Bacteroidota bacterium]
MKILSYLSILSLFVMSAMTLSAQKMNKKTRTVKVEIQINAPAEKVWEAMVLDYGEKLEIAP